MSPDQKPARVPDLVSVILPVFNGADTLEQQLDALADQTYESPWELVVSENGSTDESEAIVQAHAHRFPSFRLIDSSQRGGFSASCNQAVDVARGDFLMFTGQDDVVSPTWIEAMVDKARSCDLVGGAMEYATINSAEALEWFPTHGPVDEEPHAAMKFLPYAIGTNLGIWRDVFESHGRWNEDLRCGGEDLYLSWSVQLGGLEFGFAPEAQVSFRYRADPRALLKKSIQYAETHPYLYRRFKSQGIPRSRLINAVKDWLWIVVHLPDLARGPGPKGHWITRFGMRVGRLKGSLRERSLYL